MTLQRQRLETRLYKWNYTRQNQVLPLRWGRVPIDTSMFSLAPKDQYLRSQRRTPRRAHQFTQTCVLPKRIHTYTVLIFVLRSFAP